MTQSLCFVVHSMVYAALNKLYVVDSMYDRSNNSYYLLLSFYLPDILLGFTYTHIYLITWPYFAQASFEEWKVGTC